MKWTELEEFAEANGWHAPIAWKGGTASFAEISRPRAGRGTCLVRGIGLSVGAAKRAFCRAVEKIREAR